MPFHFVVTSPARRTIPAGLLLVLICATVVITGCQLPWSPNKPSTTGTPAASRTATKAAARTPVPSGTASASSTPTLTPTVTPTNTATPTRVPVRIQTANAGSLQVANQISNAGGSVNSAGFSPDTQSFVYGLGDGTTQLWKAGTQAPILSLRIPGAEKAKTPIAVAGVALAPDGKSMAAGAADNKAYLWRFAEMDRPVENGHGGPVWAVAFSKDSKLYASGSGDKNVQLKQVADGKSLGTLQGHTAGVRSLAFSPDGTILASGSEDRSVILWQTADRKILRRLPGHPDTVWSVAFSPNGQTLATGSDTIRLWLINEPGLPRVLDRPQNLKGPIKGLAFSTDGEILAAYGTNNYIALWSVGDGSLIGSGLTCQQCGDNQFVTMAFASDTFTFAAASSSGRLLWWVVP